MPPYDWIGSWHLVFMTGVGLGLALAVILARGSRVWGFSLRPRPDREEEEEVHEFGGGVSEMNRPVPWLIWLVFVGYFIWATAYVIFAGARGL